MTTRLVVLLTITTLYAVVRYVGFGGVAPTHVPVYLLNKSIAMASVLFLCCAAFSYLRGHAEGVRFWGKASGYGVVIHVLLSLAILTPAYLPKFFAGERMSLSGELSILFGVLSAFGLWFVHRPGSPLRRPRLARIACYLLVAAHLVAMGFINWSQPAKWHGYLPPISLVSFVFILVGAAAYLKKRAER